MKQLSIKELVRQVAMESSGVSVRTGKTNGKPVLHLIRRQKDQIEAASETIPATAVDWALHPWNKHNAPKKPKAKKEATADAA